MAGLAKRPCSMGRVWEPSLNCTKARSLLMPMGRKSGCLACLSAVRPRPESRPGPRPRTHTKLWGAQPHKKGVSSWEKICHTSEPCAWQTSGLPPFAILQQPGQSLCHAARLMKAIAQVLEGCRPRENMLPNMPRVRAAAVEDNNFCL